MDIKLSSLDQRASDQMYEKGRKYQCFQGDFVQLILYNCEAERRCNLTTLATFRKERISVPSNFRLLVVDDGENLREVLKAQRSLFMVSVTSGAACSHK